MQRTRHVRAASRAILAATLTLGLAAGAEAAGHGHGGSHGDGHQQQQPSASHGGGHGAHGGAPAIGAPGKASEASRTVEIAITDNRFTPERIEVRKGETVRFVLNNRGRLVHEFNIGTAAMHAVHQKEMAVMVEHGALMPDRIDHARMKMDMGGGKTMEHNAPNAVLLEPGKSAELVWRFDTDARLEFACNVPGHYDSGMSGDIDIRR